MMRMKVLLATLVASMLLLVTMVSFINTVASENVTVTRTDFSTVEYVGSITEEGYTRLAEELVAGDTIVFFSPGGFTNQVGAFADLLQQRSVKVEVHTCFSACAVIALYGKTVEAHGEYDGKLGFHAPASAFVVDFFPEMAGIFAGKTREELHGFILDAGYSKELADKAMNTPHNEYLEVHVDELKNYKVN